MTIVALVSGMFTKVVTGKTVCLQVQQTIPRLARELIGLMDERESWEGTASELLSFIGESGHDIPTVHNRLSAELMQDYITDALDAHGITVQRERTSERRTLR